MIKCCIYKPNSVSRTFAGTAVIYLGGELPHRSSGTPHLRAARPCTRVRILPFHPSTISASYYFEVSLYSNDLFKTIGNKETQMVLGYASLRKRPHAFRCVASLLAPLGLLRTGVTRYSSLPTLSGGVFGLSSPTISGQLSDTTKTLYNKIWKLQMCIRSPLCSVPGFLYNICILHINFYQEIL